MYNLKTLLDQNKIKVKSKINIELRHFLFEFLKTKQLKSVCFHHVFSKCLGIVRVGIKKALCLVEECSIKLYFCRQWSAA